MRSLSTKAHIALGQTCLLVTLLLTAAFLGLIPDRDGAVRVGRMALAEAIAANSSALIIQEDIERLEAVLELVVERNDDLLSAAVRRADGDPVASIGDHLRHWQVIPGGYSTPSQLSVPIWSGSQEWGRIELRYRALAGSGWTALLQNAWLHLIAFIGIGAFFSFYLYLGRTLRHLDPNRAVPPHVRSALDTLAEGLLVLDLKENIVLANSAFAAVVGVEPDKLLGRKASEFRWTDTEGAAIEANELPWTRVLHGGERHRNDPIRLDIGESRPRSFQVNCSPVLGSEGQHGGILVTFDDITVLEEHKAELSRSKEAADAANRAKSEFLANMSHEIRTPMNAILGFTEVLKRGYSKGEREWKRHLDTIHTSGKHLLQLINDILDLSKVEAGRLDVERIEVAAHTSIGDVVRVLRVKAEEKGTTLDFVVTGRIPERITCDPTRLRQIVTNLIGNAIKFTDRGGVKVSLSLSSASGQPRAVVEVADSGVGIPQDRLESVFEAFVQADSSVTRQFGGTGLGLSISRQFARAMGGDIVASSEPGKGSVFTVTLDPGPLEGVSWLEPEEAMRTSDAESAAAPGGAWRFPSARVLVVDDGEENRELLRIVLGDVGLVVEEAENGQVGVDKALAQPFDIILMDMQMPVMDGYTATARLRSREVGTPIFALTANAMKGFEQQCLEVGCTGYLTKPIDVDELFAALAAVLGGERGSAAEAAPPAPDIAEAAAAASLAPIVSSLAAGDPRYQPIIGKFVERLATQLEAAERASERRDLEELARFAHWLKGSAGTVGFEVFTEPARHLEELAKAGEEARVEAALGGLREMAGRLSVSDEEPRVEVARAAIAAAAEAAQRPSPASSVIAIHRGTDPRFRRIRQKFVGRLEQRFAELDRAWGERDFEELARFAHWLKGSGGTVGIDELTEPAEELERLARSGDESAVAASLAALRPLAQAVIRGVESEAEAV